MCELWLARRRADSRPRTSCAIRTGFHPQLLSQSMNNPATPLRPMTPADLATADEGLAAQAAGLGEIQQHLASLVDPHIQAASALRDGARKALGRGMARAVKHQTGLVEQAVAGLGQTVGDTVGMAEAVVSQLGQAAGTGLIIPQPSTFQLGPPTPQPPPSLAIIPQPSGYAGVVGLWDIYCMCPVPDPTLGIPPGRGIYTIPHGTKLQAVPKSQGFIYIATIMAIPNDPQYDLAPWSMQIGEA